MLLSKANAAEQCDRRDAPPQSPPGAATTLAIISDMHINSSQLSSEFTSALQNIRTKHNISNIIIPGDIGETASYISGALNSINTIFKPQESNAIVILGNHDVRGPDSSKWTKDPQAENPYFRTILAQYRQQNSRVSYGEGHSCFDLKIDGHHFIALNTDRGLKDQAYFDPATLEWFANKMAEETAGRKIVIVHQPLNDTHWRSNLYDGFGQQDAQVKAILAQYPQTFVISGHIHNGFGVLEVMQKTFGTLLEIPSFNRTENGLIEKGYGFIMHIHEDRFIFEAWNFLKEQHYPEFDMVVPFSTVANILSESESGCEGPATADVYPWDRISKQVDSANSIVAGPDKFGVRKIWPTWRWERYGEKA